MRGRKPTPGPEKEARGNPGHRPIKPEPQFAAATDDECPVKLDPFAKAEWDRVAPELRRANLLRVTDYSLLACYCQAVSASQRAWQFVVDGGLAATIGRRSALKVFDDAMKSAKSLGAEFGLTPSSRSRLAAPEDKKDAMEEFLQVRKDAPVDPKLN